MFGVGQTPPFFEDGGHTSLISFLYEIIGLNLIDLQLKMIFFVDHQIVNYIHNSIFLNNPHYP